MGNTTKLYTWDGAAWQFWKAGSDIWDGASWRTIKGVWAWSGASWILRYSTPTAAASNTSGNASGNSSSGLVTSGTPGAVTGGYASGNWSYLWTYVSGSVGISPSNVGALNPTFSGSPSGAAPQGGTANLSAVWQLVATDTDTGATTAPVQISVSLTWTNTSTIPIVVTAHNFSNTVHTSNSPGGPQPAVVGVNCDMTPFISGGNGNYLYSWVFVTGSPTNVFNINDPTIVNPIMSTTVFTVPNDAQTAVAVWQLTVNDTIGSPPGSAQVQTFHTHARP